MKIGICITKRHRGTNPIYNILEKGIKANGDEVTWVTKETEIRLLRSCEAFFQVGEFCNSKSSGNSSIRQKLAHWSHAQKVRRIVIDTGYLHNCKSKTSNKYYHSMGYDGIKGFGNFYNDDSPSDRFDKLNIDIKPWVDNSGDVLLATINDTGWSSSFYNDQAWMKQVIQHILDNSDRRILIKPHPNSAKRFMRSSIFKGLFHKFGRDRLYVYPQQNLSISKMFSKTYCCLTTGSNSTVDSIVSGIPIICPADFNIAYNMGSHSIESLDNLYRPDNREQFLYNIAYAQWSDKEISSGEAWSHLRPHIHTPYRNPLRMIKYVETHNIKYKLPK